MTPLFTGAPKAIVKEFSQQRVRRGRYISAASAYAVSRSLRFNSADSAYLSRTPASAGNQTTMTFSLWLKLGKLGSNRRIYCGGSTAWNDGVIQISNGDKLELILNNGSSQAARLTSTRVFRDPSAWYHIVVNYDSTNGTASDRWRMYVNGERITVFDSASYPGSSVAWRGVNSTDTQFIGTGWDGLPFDGYLADIHFIDGYAYDPSYFGETNATTGVWDPKTYSGSYGSQGWHLDFADNSAATAAALGKDTSGNSNNWTPNNLSIVTGGPTSVAAASGALPIYNTTDTYGEVKGSGTRTDSNSANIELALPMDGPNNGTTFTEESATIKGSGSAKTVTRFGNTKTSTVQKKFYDSSAYFDGTDDYLSLSGGLPSGTSNFTLEAWIYLDNLSNARMICGSDGTSGVEFYVSSSGQLTIDHAGTTNIASSSANKISAGAWSHVAVTRNSNTFTLYVDGINVASGSNSINISGNTSLGKHRSNGAQYFVGYMQDVRFYSTVKYTSNFNPPRSTQNATVGAGNDSLVDSLTNGSQTDTGLGGEVVGNYATLNPLHLAPSGGGNAPTLSNGNLDVSGSNIWSRFLSLGVSSGKWYAEALVTGNGDEIIGISQNRTPSSNAWIGSATWGSGLGYGYSDSDGKIYNNGTGSTYGNTYGTNDTIGIALDMDNGKVYFSKNGTWQNSGNPATQANPAVTGLTGTWFIGVSNGGSGSTSSYSVNAGSRPFAYTAPSGFKALNTANLPTPTIANGATAMDVALWTGSNIANARTISGLQISPDLVWIKNRTTSYGHQLFDSVRGTTRTMLSNTTAAEIVNDVDGTLSAFNSDGFTTSPITNNSSFNHPSHSYVAWAWDGGSSTVSNTSGSITSSVRANASAGFSVVTWTSNGSNTNTIGHGLNVRPSVVLYKTRSTASGWYWWTNAVDGSEDYLRLENTDAKVDINTGTYGSPNSTTFTNFGFVNGTTMVAYCFAPVAGYSSFGSYTGNGSADGPFVYTGFRPRWILIKASSSVSYGSWRLHDTARDPYNVCGNQLLPNASDAEYGPGSVGTVMDILSNGFKLRSTFDGWNGSGSTYIYAAFAESPINYSRAR